MHHVLFDCPLLAELHEEYGFTSMEDAFDRVDIGQFFMKMEHELGISAR